ncbi:MAG: zinc-ribbon domain-containing protein [Ignisphaera sp.]
MSFCPYCGKPVPEWAKFCKHCGKRLTEEVPARHKTQRGRVEQWPASSDYYIPVKAQKKRRIGKGTIILLLLVMMLITLNILAYVNLQEITGKYEILRNDYSKLKSNYNTLKTSYEKLKSDYNNLDNTYQRLKSDYSSLEVSYEKLKSDYNALQYSYQQLRLNYEYALQNYGSLSNKVSKLYNSFKLYHIPEAFKRCLNDEEIRKVASVVSQISNPNYSWDTYERIYNYIVSNIKYARDIDMLYVTEIGRILLDSNYYVVDFTIGSTSDYTQPPSLTLKIKQGDCEDQAILAYAMIKYYYRYIHGREYNLYIAEVVFNDGSAHAAVILPVMGGKVCIIDPAGNYLTSTFDSWTWTRRIASKDAVSELQAYSNHWFSNRGIKSITLYDINVSDGSYWIVASGSLSEIASFLSRS